ncbi:MAG: methyltransferase type 11, partial [Acidimicrobiia bacterium]|nr:methyltransferase type 11 [Acidimicrobiia bacterium]
IRTDRPDNAEAVAAWAHAAGLERLAYKELVETHSSTPADFADVIEKRSFSWIWDLDEQTWNEVVQPVIDGLRALPEPTRGRSVTLRRDLLAFTR